MRVTQRKSFDALDNAPRMTGEAAECLLKGELLLRKFQCYDVVSDNGVDLRVDGRDAQGNLLSKKVQVTTGTAHDTTEGAFVITKKASKVREDVDIVAVHVRGNHNGCNSGQVGMQDMWFFIPNDVYADTRMFRYYNTNVTSWYVQINKTFKPPLDKAFNAWWVFNRSQESLEKETESFFD